MWHRDSLRDVARTGRRDGCLLIRRRRPAGGPDEKASSSRRDPAEILVSDSRRGGTPPGGTQCRLVASLSSIGNLSPHISPHIEALLAYFALHPRVRSLARSFPQTARLPLWRSGGTPRFE